WRSYANGVIADVGGGNASNVRNVIASGQGKDRFDAFRRAQNRLSTSLERDVAASRDRLRDTVNRSIIAFVIAVAVGVLLVAVLWTWWRIAGRRQAELERHRGDIGLLMQAVIDATTDSIFAKEPSGAHIVANRARAAALSGGDPNAEVVGKT